MSQEENTYKACIIKNITYSRLGTNVTNILSWIDLLQENISKYKGNNNDNFVECYTGNMIDDIREIRTIYGIDAKILDKPTKIKDDIPTDIDIETRIQKSLTWLSESKGFIQELYKECSKEHNDSTNNHQNVKDAVNLYTLAVLADINDIRNMYSITRATIDTQRRNSQKKEEVPEQR